MLALIIMQSVLNFSNASPRRNRSEGLTAKEEKQVVPIATLVLEETTVVPHNLTAPASIGSTNTSNKTKNAAHSPGYYWSNHVGPMQSLICYCALLQTEYLETPTLSRLSIRAYSEKVGISKSVHQKYVHADPKKRLPLPAFNSTPSRTLQTPSGRQDALS